MPEGKLSKRQRTIRAKAAKAALVKYARAGYFTKGAKITDKRFTSELESIFGDLLCDLQHFAELNGIDFDERLANGRMHFNAEMQGEPEPRIDEEPDENEDEEPTCSDCGTTENVDSSYCGSFCNTCREKHNEDCEVCRKDWES